MGIGYTQNTPDHLKPDHLSFDEETTKIVQMHTRKPFYDQYEAVGLTGLTRWRHSVGQRHLGSIGRLLHEGLGSRH